MDLPAIEDRLRSERRELAVTLEHINALLSQSQIDETGELSMVDQHLADIATETESREMDIVRRKLLEDRIALIDDALERLANDRYGRCVVCDEPIQEERLKALPWTPFCLTHATLEGSPASPPPQRRR